MPVSDYGERLIDQAIRAGKFPESRREHYRQLYTANGGHTEQLIARLEPVRVLAARVAERDEPLPRHWFRQQPIAASASAAHDPGLPEEWFPEARRARTLAAAGQRPRGRVTSSNGR